MLACKNENSQAGDCSICVTYLGNTVNVKPIILATLTTDFCMPVPDFVVGTLTWGGSALAVPDRILIAFVAELTLYGF